MEEGQKYAHFVPLPGSASSNPYRRGICKMLLCRYPVGFHLDSIRTCCSPSYFIIVVITMLPIKMDNIKNFNGR
jgi:hypothetical protein